MVNGHAAATMPNGDANHNVPKEGGVHFSGTFYLTQLNSLFHRTYEQQQ